MQYSTSESSDITSSSASAVNLDVVDNTEVDQLLRNISTLLSEIEEYFGYPPVAEHSRESANQSSANQSAYGHVRQSNKGKFAADETRKERRKRPKRKSAAEYDESSSAGTFIVDVAMEEDTAIPNVDINDRSCVSACSVRGQSRALASVCKQLLQHRVFSNANVALASCCKHHCYFMWL